MKLRVDWKWTDKSANDVTRVRRVANKKNVAVVESQLVKETNDALQCCHGFGEIKHDKAILLHEGKMLHCRSHTFEWHACVRIGNNPVQ